MRPLLAFVPVVALLVACGYGVFDSYSRIAQTAAAVAAVAVCIASAGLVIAAISRNLGRLLTQSTRVRFAFITVAAVIATGTESSGPWARLAVFSAYGGAMAAFLGWLSHAWATATKPIEPKAQHTESAPLKRL